MFLIVLKDNSYLSKGQVVDKVFNLYFRKKN